jgi:hypothetical protein
VLRWHTERHGYGHWLALNVCVVGRRIIQSRVLVATVIFSVRNTHHRVQKRRTGAWMTINCIRKIRPGLFFAVLWVISLLITVRAPSHRCETAEKNLVLRSNTSDWIWLIGTFHVECCTWKPVSSCATGMSIFDCSIRGELSELTKYLLIELRMEMKVVLKVCKSGVHTDLSRCSPSAVHELSPKSDKIVLQMAIHWKENDFNIFPGVQIFGTKSNQWTRERSFSIHLKWLWTKNPGQCVVVQIKKPIELNRTRIVSPNDQ